LVDIFTVWASAGCGKTRFCTDMAATYIKSGYCSKEQVLYSTFAREAANDAAGRAGVTGEERRHLWFRTLHSVCFKLLRVGRGQVVSGAKLREFGGRMGVEINDELAMEEDEAADISKIILAIERVRSSSEESGTAISKLLGMYQHARLTSESMADLERARKEPSPSALQYFGHMDWSRYADVVESYENWKGGELLDFVDMLERVLLRPIDLPDWKVVFIDEAQDLSPLQWLVVDKLADRARVAYYAGDDFQAIMSFQGSSAASFLSYRNRSRRIHLPTTHRFGQKIIDLGQRIVQGLPDSEPKHIVPAKAINNTIRRIWDVEEATEAYGSKFWLHRHREGCNALSAHCIMNGIPFWAERGANPLGKGVEIAGYRSIAKLVRGETLDGADIKSMTKVVRVSKEINGERVKFLKHGSMSKLEDMEPGQSITPLELSQHFTEFFWDALRGGDWSVTDIRFASYYQALEESGWELGGDLEPQITITTIHGSKGRDADTVFLWDEVLPRCMKDPSELRVAYVGATRSKGPLYIVSSPVTSWRMENFPYPIEDGD
jgi:superfamily I DNA/RNA helicase